MSEYDVNIGKAIKIGRLQKKMSQKELAELMGVKPPLVSRWENNHIVPYGDDLIKMVEALDILDLLFPSAQKSGLASSRTDKERAALLGYKLRMLCINNEVKTKELSRYLECSETSILKWQAGEEMIPTSALFKMADIFEVSLDYFDVRGRAKPVLVGEEDPLLREMAELKKNMREIRDQLQQTSKQGKRAAK